MIPADFIAEWRAHTRWATDEQVEQDLVLARALVAIFEDPQLAASLALRGGTLVQDVTETVHTVHSDCFAAEISKERAVQSLHQSCLFVSQRSKFLFTSAL